MAAAPSTTSSTNTNNSAAANGNINNSNSNSNSNSTGIGLSRELGRTSKRQRLGYSRSIGTVNSLLELCQTLTGIPSLTHPLT
jgi:hypothetical protein